MWAFTMGQQESVGSWLEPKLRASRSQASRPVVAPASESCPWPLPAPWKTAVTCAGRANVTQDVGTSGPHHAVTVPRGVGESRSRLRRTLLLRLGAQGFLAFLDFFQLHF